MASRVIALQGEPIVDEQKMAVEAITPGMLIQVNAGKWRKHADAAKNAPPWFALEREELGKGIDDDYAIDDQVKAGRFSKGDKVNALIASGQNVSDGDYLESAGDGTLKVVATDAATDDTQRISTVAQAAENSGEVTALTRLKVWIV